VLDLNERRVLGVLVEKAKTTPDVYPLSVNALVAGANQKSNREPLLNLSDHDVEETLARLQRRNLVLRVTGSRVDRWRHNLYEAWALEKVDLAVLGELLLRGPQTEGELRTRASRMEPIEDLDALRGVLRPLAQRNLVVYMTPEERRGSVLTHGFHDPQELERLRTRHAAEAAAGAAHQASPRAVNPGLEASLAEARGEIEALKEAVVRLQAEVAELREEVRGRRQAPAGNAP
jgi:uncharacterized protein YceH (UPF0502 family)